MEETIGCPACKGKTGVVLQDVLDEQPERAGCRVCGGLGLVDLATAHRLWRGRELREARLRRGESLWQAAFRQGIDPLVLSRREAGEDV